MSDSCATCFYFSPESAEVTERGYCRRRPPTVFHMGSAAGGPTFLSIFPPMQAVGWCGEHPMAVYGAQQHVSDELNARRGTMGIANQPAQQQQRPTEQPASDTAAYAKLLASANKTKQ